MMRFTKDHEWIRFDGETATVGITAYAATQLGDVVYVELPQPGTRFEAGADMAVVESAKAASDVYAPVSGEVIAVNEALTGTPQLVNEEPHGEGWFVKLRLSAPDQMDALMDEQAYTALTGGAG